MASISVQDRTPFLDTAIMPTSDDLAVDDQYRAEGNAALGQTFTSLLDGGLKKLVLSLLSHGTDLDSQYRIRSSYFPHACRATNASSRNACCIGIERSPTGFLTSR